MQSFLSRINNFFSMLCGWLMLLLMVLLVVDFVGRGIPSSLLALGETLQSQSLMALSEAEWLQPMSILADLSVFCMIIVLYLGLGLCEERDQNVRVEAIDSFLSGKARRAMHCLSYVLQTGIVWIMIYAFYKNVLRSFNSGEAISGMVPIIIWPVKACALFGLFLYALQLTLKCLQSMRNINIAEPAHDPVQTSGAQGGFE